MGDKSLGHFYTAVGNEVRMARSRHGLSQTELFKLTGIHRETISRIEDGSQRLALHQLVLLCNAFEITPSKFLKEVINYEIES